MKTTFSFWITLLLPFLAIGQVELKNSPIYFFGDQVYYFETKNEDIGINSIIDLNDEFVSSERNVPNLGISNSIWWIRFQVQNNSTLEDPVLEVPKPSLDHVYFYHLDGSTLVDSVYMGVEKQISERNFQHQNYVFDLNIPENETRTIYLKIKSQDQIQIPLNIAGKLTIFDNLATYDLTFFGIFTGIFFVMFFYNLFIFLSTRNKSYLLYVVHLVAVYFTQMSLTGFGFRFFWPESSFLELNSIQLFSGLTGITVILFFVEFVHLKKSYPFGYKVLIYSIPLYVIAIALSLLGFYGASYMLLQLLIGSASAFLMFILIKLVRQGVREARYFLLAWGIFIAATFMFIIKDFNILPYNMLTASGMQIGSAIEVVLLSFALADRINILKKEKEQSQARALLALRENERIIKEQNVILESKVKERTERLQKSNEELTLTLEELKSTQAQLVDAEKMASLGQLTAGIAHELNNPINFVASNVKPLERDFNDLMKVLDKVDEIAAANQEDANFAEVIQLKNELDTDYLRDEIRQLLSGVAEGAKRTAEIVRGLRIFSRLDEDSLKKANINECLESTIIVLKSHVRGRAKVIREFEDELMPIKCYPGKLNQVFMNIISNAVQATEMSDKPLSERWVKVKSFQDSENIYVSIRDNGCGMDEETQHKIFDPFFTTKDVGEGTGLGLSIVLGIIQDHHGDIEVKSTVNEGTEFLITLSKSLNPEPL